MKISAAGNTEVPAYLVLLELGYEISVKDLADRTQFWTATKGNTQVSGEGPLELLGLVKLVECRGEDWKANDNEIEDFVSKYC